MISGTVLGLLAASYLTGSVPTSYLAGRAAGVDLRRRGSGNLGTTNVYRVLGAGPAVPVLAVDFLKGFLPVWYFPLWDGSAFPQLSVLYGVAAIAGHVWSAFLGFRGGGKGVATGAGAVFAVATGAATVGALIWAGVAALTRTASVASLTAVTAVPPAAVLLDAPPSAVAFSVLLAALVWWTHRDNLLRLWRGEERELDRRRNGVLGREGKDAP